MTGTPVGCACRDGLIDWKKVIQIVRKDCPRDTMLSVERGTVEQAEPSVKHLRPLLKQIAERGRPDTIRPGLGRTGWGRLDSDR